MPKATAAPQPKSKEPKASMPAAKSSSKAPSEGPVKAAAKTAAKMAPGSAAKSSKAPAKPAAKLAAKTAPPPAPVDSVPLFLKRLEKDDSRVMTDFVNWASQPGLSPKEIEGIHEFIEEAEHRIRNSRSKLDRVEAALLLLKLLRDDSRRLGMHERFLASICGALCTYFQNRKIWDPAVEACEFLVRRAIPDEDGVGFHERLDWLYRQRARRPTE